MPYDTESQSRNVSCVPFRGRGPRSGEGIYEGKNDYDTRYGRDRRRRHYNTHCPLKGKRLTTFCASLALLQPLLSLTHWIFGSLLLPYKSSSHSAKCVRCASLCSGGRRLAVRTAMDHPIGALPRTPFPASRDFAPVGSVSLDFQVASLSYKSSSFATSRGNERYEGKSNESYTSRTISAFSPFGGCRHHLA